MPVVKLTPNMLKRMVLEEKKNLENKAKMDAAALKAMEMKMDEEDVSSGSVVKHAKKSSDSSFQGHGYGDVAGYKKMKELMKEEEALEMRLEQIKEHRAALRRRILGSR
jgi:hypothetical protein